MSSVFMNDTTARSLADSLPKAQWAKTGLLLLLVLVAIVALFYETAWSIVSIWIRSETYAHGFLIVPISLWLVWQKRSSLAKFAPQPAYLPIVLMLGVGFAWLLGYLVDVLVVKQLAFVGLVVLSIWAVIGTPAARVLAFPIGFLFFAVPVGEALIHPLMNFTADFTVHLLRLTGIPVYREGTFFSIPTGEWSVVEGCSGLRYLIASVTLGVLYAYLTYIKLWKRLLFVVISIGVPIIANGLRAYMIVMIAHLSGNKLALGIDHLIYGWVFFGIVVTIMFLIGAFWRDPPQEEEVSKKPIGGRRLGSSIIVIAVASVLVAAIWPALAWTLARTPPAATAPIKLQAPVGVDGWRQSKVSAWDWRPHVVNPDGSLYQFYVKGQQTPVGLYLGAYRSQRHGAELLTSQNYMIRQKHPVWSQTELTTRLVRLDGKEDFVKQSDLKSINGQRLLAWYWYRVGDRYTGDQYIGKLYELLERVVAHRRDGVFIAVTTQYDDKEQKAAKRLQAFLVQMLPSIERELDRAVGAH
jgi:exosortase A